MKSTAWPQGLFLSARGHLARSHAQQTALTSTYRLFLLTCRQSAEPPQPPPPSAAPAAAPSVPLTEETDNDGSVGKKMHRRNPSGVALSETVTDTVTCATSDESGDIGALGSEFMESDERFVWCGNHVFDAHSGELRWTDRPDHLSLKRGDRVMEIMKFNARAQLRDHQARGGVCARETGAWATRVSRII